MPIDGLWQAPSRPKKLGHDRGRAKVIEPTHEHDQASTLKLEIEVAYFEH